MKLLLISISLFFISCSSKQVVILEPDSLICSYHLPAVNKDIIVDSVDGNDFGMKFIKFKNAYNEICYDN